MGPGLVLVVLFTFVQNVTYDGYFKIHCFGIDFIRHITIKICTSLPFPSLKKLKKLKIELSWLGAGDRLNCPHFETTCKDVLATYKRATGEEFDFSKIKIPEEGDTEQ